MSTVGTIKWLIRGDDSKLSEDLNKSRATAEKSASGFGSAAKKIGGAIAAAMSVKAIAEWGSSFETSMAAASTLFGDVAVNTEALNKEMLALSNRTGMAADELGGALYSALSAGVPVTEDMSAALDFLEQSSKLAAAGFTDIDTAMGATIKTINAYGMDLDQTDRVQKILIQTQNKGIATVDELGQVLAQVTPTAALMGVEFEQVGAALATMTAKGTPAAQATTGLNAMLAELGKEGTKSSDKFRELTGNIQEGGLSFTEAMEMGWDLNDVLAVFQEEAEASGLTLMDFFGSIQAGKAAAQIFGEDFVNNLDAMSTEIDVVGESYDKVTSTSGFQFNKMLNELKNIAIELFLVIAPFLTDILPQLAELLRMILPPLMELIEKLLPPLLEIFEKLIPPIAHIIEALLPVLISLFELLLPPITALLELLGDVIDWLVSVFLGDWSETWEAVKETATRVWVAIQRFITDTWEALKNLAVEIWQSITLFFVDTWQGIAKTAAHIWNAIVKFFADIWIGIRTAAIAAWEGIANFFSSIWQGISKTAVNLFETLLSFFTDIWSRITGVFSGAIEKVKRYFADLRDGIKQIIDGVRKIFEGLIEFISGVFTGNWTKALKGLTKIFGGIFDGLKGLVKAPINWIVDGLNTFIRGLNRIKIPNWVPVIGGKGIRLPQIPRLKVGLDYVPGDEFPALLHAGEAVLTAEEADRWRSGLPRYDAPEYGATRRTPVVVNLTATIEADGYTLGKVVMENIDDVRFYG